MMPRKCEYCGNEFEPRQPQHRFCSITCLNSAQSGRGSAPIPPRESRATLPDGYLREGYFADDAKKVLRSEFVDEWAQEVAKALADAGITASQMRFFYAKIQAIQSRLENKASLQEVRPDILTLKADAALRAGRGTVAELLKKVIDLNADEAAKDVEAFRKGFFVHFQTVLKYFVFYTRGR